MSSNFAWAIKTFPLPLLFKFSFLCDLIWVYLYFCTFCIFYILVFLASQDALEVMLVTEWLNGVLETFWCDPDIIMSEDTYWKLYWCDSGMWGYSWQVRCYRAQKSFDPKISWLSHLLSFASLLETDFWLFSLIAGLLMFLFWDQCPVQPQCNLTIKRIWGNLL